MMKFIEFDQEKCDNCYKCLRTCPTKAISFSKDKRHIIDNLCIKCGLCQQSCPQEALSIKSQVGFLQNLLNEGEKVVVSIAPSFVCAFILDEPNSIVGALKSLGIFAVEETAIGAGMVAEKYDEFIDQGEYNNLITSCCPSAMYLIEQHYPDLIASVIPLVSPMIAHGKSIKKRYGEDVKVFFIGPCLAKMAEAEELSGAIDGVLTFDEIDRLFKNMGKRLGDFESLDFDNDSTSRGKAFPLGGSLKRKNNSLVDSKYKMVHVDGIEGCKQVLEEIRTGTLNNCCIELNICDGSCINGLDMPKDYLGRFAREMYMRAYVEKTGQTKIMNEKEARLELNQEGINLERTFKNKQILQYEPDAKMVSQTMAKMGKYSAEDELNCGACGYKTCYDKAKAVYLGYSDIETCLPHLRAKAESMQNTMIENSPNGVLLADDELFIKEVNPSFTWMFNNDNLPIEGLPIKLFLNHPIFDEVVVKKKSVHNKKIYVEDMQKYFLANVVYLYEQNWILVFLTDITIEEKRKEAFKQVKEETLSKTKEVIDKQMRVAQEIASLLGETTEQTKMILKSLYEMVMNYRGDF
ncbi:MAG: 4Fe-4S binding protein [Vallitaleaceae bacterium]|jgi:iron only hydrogenase large subunit-like protein/uncharacterized Fe-S cluster-containing protein|nr:4Fe-4S binding protein [Vallitaleaceae bacterium]